MVDPFLFSMMSWNSGGRWSRQQSNNITYKNNIEKSHKKSAAKNNW